MNINRHDGTDGFTLVELLIVIAIVAVLMSIVLPSYQDSIRKGRRSDAMSALMDASNREEQFMLDRNTYTTTISAGGLNMSTLSQDGHYTITAVAGANGITRSYSLTATPVATSPQADDSKCLSFTITSSGSKTATGTLGNKCWGQ